MDTFTTMTGLITMVTAAFGEYFKRGAYLWLSALFMMIFALRMGEELFYMASAGYITVVIIRTFIDDDVTDEEDED